MPEFWQGAPGDQAIESQAQRSLRADGLGGAHAQLPRSRHGQRRWQADGESADGPIGKLDAGVARLVEFAVELALAVEVERATIRFGNMDQGRKLAEDKER